PTIRPSGSRGSIMAVCASGAEPMTTALEVPGTSAEWMQRTGSSARPGETTPVSPQAASTARQILRMVPPRWRAYDAYVGQASRLPCGSIRRFHPDMSTDRQPEVERVEDGGVLIYHEHFLAREEADALFTHLREGVAWKQERGSWGAPYPRLTALYGD